MSEHVPHLDPREWIGRRVQVVVDRPLGTTHPEYGFTYEINYGFVPGTTAADDHEIDAYVLGSDAPLAECEGEVIALIHRRDDVEDKLVVSLSGPVDRDGIARAVAFQERWFDNEVIVDPSGP